MLRCLAGCAAALTLLVAGGTARAQSYSNMKDQLIFHYCSKAMNSDFNKAGKSAPAGMVAYTCNCVVQQMDARATIEQAKAICQATAQQKFTVQ